MYDKLDLGSCYYKPSFFNMKIDLPISLGDLNDLPEGAMGLYYHEYIHFIQDISTIYGLMNISTINYYIQSCAHHVEKNKSQKAFKVPIELNEIIDNSKTNDSGLLNFALRPVYMGSSIKNKSKTIADFTYQVIPYEYSKGEFIDKVSITFIDSITGEKRCLDFGGNHVTEGMAYLCEQFNYKDILPVAEDYPYTIVQKIVENIYPEIIEEKILIIALCDISLMSYHPGLSFVRLLNFIKDKNIVHPDLSLEDLYSDCLAFIKGSHVEYSDLVDIIKAEIKKNFKADYFDDTNAWIDSIFDRIKKIRTDIPTFINDLVRFGKPSVNQFFKHLVNFVGSPLVLNSDYDGTIALPHNFKIQTEHFNPGIFLALNQVLRMFYIDKPTVCDLKEYCLSSKKVNPNLEIDEDCDLAPWKKAKSTNLCPVGAIWHHWALKDFYPNHMS
ncbi:hypothetical protein [Saccharicrinis aurantiacus]|uniref:hypothetical protein n=1 Tax=Saccharicrinis aurantiacus TaxID=1849719 RepID=UPI00249359C3|nr:hypothetical protein [Saccharicrinis aurantiacus]